MFFQITNYDFLSCDLLSYLSKNVSCDFLSYDFLSVTFYLVFFGFTRLGIELRIYLTRFVKFYSTGDRTQDLPHSICKVLHNEMNRKTKKKLLLSKYFTHFINMYVANVESFGFNWGILTGWRISYDHMIWNAMLD